MQETLRARCKGQSGADTINRSTAIPDSCLGTYSMHGQNRIGTVTGCTRLMVRSANDLADDSSATSYMASTATVGFGAARYRRLPVCTALAEGAEVAAFE